MDQASYFPPLHKPVRNKFRRKADSADKWKIAANIILPLVSVSIFWCYYVISLKRLIVKETRIFVYSNVTIYIVGYLPY
jgi:hypothetical protein